jgi:hypothetical protein
VDEEQISEMVLSKSMRLQEARPSSRRVIRGRRSVVNLDPQQNYYRDGDSQMVWQQGTGLIEVEMSEQLGEI